MKFLACFTMLLLNACSTAEIRPMTTPGTWQLQAKYEVDLRGGSSDLCWDEQNSNENIDTIWSITDRGPNGEDFKKNAKSYRPFLEPTFSPTISQIKILNKENTATVIKSIRLRKADGKPLSGLPNVDPGKTTKRFDEIPVDENNKLLLFDPAGMDTEGLVCMGAQGFYVSEEYGPSIAKFNLDGDLVYRWSPKESNKKWTSLRSGQRDLPGFLAKRTMNRGFEAATRMKNGNIIFILQSEIDKKSDRNLVPILEWNPQDEKSVALYYYELDSQGGKIGAATMSPSGEILVLEQNGLTGPKAWQKVFSIELSKAQNFLSEANKKLYDWAPPTNVIPAKKSELIDLSNLGLSAFEKLEGMTMNSHGEIYIANDTDFNVPPFKRNEKSFIFKLVRAP
jgi:hypothetical protein